MSSIAEAWFSDGMDQGLHQGFQERFQQGFEEGFEKGLEEGLCKTISTVIVAQLSNCDSAQLREILRRVLETEDLGTALIRLLSTTPNGR